MKNGYAICLNEWIYDNKIKTELRLLLTISNLTAKNGYCYANNIYLANKLNTTTVTISKQIKNLEKSGYLSIKYKRKGVVITGREIRLKTEQSTIKENFNGAVKESFNTTVKENFKDNNTSNINNTQVACEYPEGVFLENWTTCRQHYLKQPTFIKKLNTFESNSFADAKKNYTKEQINDAMQTLFTQERIPNDSMLLRPKHFLNSIDTYYTGQKSKTIYGTKQVAE